VQDRESTPAKDRCSTTVVWLIGAVVCLLAATVGPMSI